MAPGIRLGRRLFFLSAFAHACQGFGGLRIPSRVGKVQFPNWTTSMTFQRDWEAGLAALSNLGPISRQGALQGAFSAGLALTGLSTEPWSPGPPRELVYDVKNERIFDTSRSSYLPAEPGRLIHPPFLKNCRLLCLGESHTHPLHHRMQFNFIKAMNFASQELGEPMVVGLEMFYRQQQAALDRFVYFHGNLALLKAETQWDQTWGFDFNNYAKIFRYARENGIRLMGLNAPGALVSLVGAKGVNGLPKELRELLPDMDLAQEKHRRRFMATMASTAEQHGGELGEEVLGRMYEAQTLWDEYMADSASSYLKRKPSGRMALLAGTGHIESRDGIPDRVERRTGERPFTVVPLSVAWTVEGLPDIDRPQGAAFADWVYYTQRQASSAA